MMGADVADYPPRLLITAQSNLDFTSPKICVEGLDRKCGFNLFIPVSRKGRSRNASVCDELLCFFYLHPSQVTKVPQTPKCKSCHQLLPHVTKVQQNPKCQSHRQLLHKVSFLHSFCFSQQSMSRLPMGHINSILVISIPVPALALRDAWYTYH